MKLLEDVNVYDPISSLLLGYNNAMFLLKVVVLVGHKYAGFFLK